MNTGFTQAVSFENIDNVTGDTYETKSIALTNEYRNLCFKYEKEASDNGFTLKDFSGTVYQTYTELDLHELKTI